MDKLGSNPANKCAITPLGFLERTATVYGDCPSVVYHSTVYTWSETHRRCLRLASALCSLGISRRDVVISPFFSISTNQYVPFGHTPFIRFKIRNYSSHSTDQTVLFLYHRYRCLLQTYRRCTKCTSVYQ